MGALLEHVRLLSKKCVDIRRQDIVIFGNRNCHDFIDRLYTISEECKDLFSIYGDKD